MFTPLRIQKPADSSQFKAGQTLIETVVAIFLLTTGIIGGLGLAIFAIGASDVTLNQIIATNLAREGIEVVRNIRDTNWLTDALADCSAEIGTGQQCYKNWDSGFPGVPGEVRFRAEFNPAANTWTLAPAGLPQFELYQGTDGSYVHSGTAQTRFYRRIAIDVDTAAPFSSSNRRLLVRSISWWSGRNCPETNDPSSTVCKVVIEEYLTNWKNY